MPVRLFRRDVCINVDNLPQFAAQAARSGKQQFSGILAGFRYIIEVHPCATCPTLYLLSASYLRL